MSNFAQIITSFERSGKFPLEANYIFPTEEALKDFYSDPVQAATLHKGLLRVVEQDPDGNQALYWVTKKAGSDELEFTSLFIGSNSAALNAKIEQLKEQLKKETEDRIAEDKKLSDKIDAISPGTALEWIGVQ